MNYLTENALSCKVLFKSEVPRKVMCKNRNMFTGKQILSFHE